MQHCDIAISKKHLLSYGKRSVKIGFQISKIKNIFFHKADAGNIGFYG
jgi:hypothetical protein